MFICRVKCCDSQRSSALPTILCLLWHIWCLSPTDKKDIEKTNWAWFDDIILNDINVLLNHFLSCAIQIFGEALSDDVLGQALGYKLYHDLQFIYSLNTVTTSQYTRPRRRSRASAHAKQTMGKCFEKCTLFICLNQICQSNPLCKSYSDKQQLISVLIIKHFTQKFPVDLNNHWSRVFKVCNSWHLSSPQTFPDWCAWAPVWFQLHLEEKNVTVKHLWCKTHRQNVSEVVVTGSRGQSVGLH